MEISDFAEEMTTPIHDFLVKNSESHTIRCYMPGHKGTEDPLDITEIDGADSLYDTDTNGGKGIIACSLKVSMHKKQAVMQGKRLREEDKRTLLRDKRP